MNFILDTCVLSETVKPVPDEGLISWLRAQDPSALFITALTIGELRKGIDRLSAGKKRHDLSLWLAALCREYGDRVLTFDTECGLSWGSLSAAMEASGSPLPVVDGLIAASALRYGASLVTRNEEDYRRSGVTLINPWSC